jgi:dTDP-glucose pyrophosphorylase
MANVKDLIAQAIQHAVWYVKKQTGAVYEGENKIADNLDELEVRLSQKANQDELLALEVKLRTKKILIDS